MSNLMEDEPADDLVTEEDGYRERIYSHPKGRDFSIRCSDPYGLWTIHPKKGPTPIKLSGQYTNADLAILDINSWMSDWEPPNPGNPNTEKPNKRVLVPKEPQVA